MCNFFWKFCWNFSEMNLMFLEVWRIFFSKILEIFWIFSRKISWNETGQLYPDIMFGASVHGHPIQKRLKNFPKFLWKFADFFSIFWTNFSLKVITQWPLSPSVGSNSGSLSTIFSRRLYNPNPIRPKSCNLIPL